MEVLEKMRQWLRLYPGFQDSWEIHMDCTDGSSRNLGLFPRGLEIKNRKTDVIGNVTCCCLYRFRLEIAAGEPRQVLDFQNWVYDQSVRGLAPRFGDDPSAETMTAERGQLLKLRRPGMPMYEVGLTARFTKKYEVK